uniref:Uncharacterized protein n=1 Tax=Arundo donax TaxID=35708 RepID=A0A0A9GIL6_ARUDO
MLTFLLRIQRAHFIRVSRGDAQKVNHQCSKGIATKKQRKQHTISAQLLERGVLEQFIKLNSVMAL